MRVFENREKCANISIRETGIFRGSNWNTMRAALYARVSTRDQNSIPMQLDSMRQYARLREWEIVKEVEESESGAKTNRKGRAEIISLSKKNKIDVVLVWKLNRWSRSTTDLLLTLSELEACRVSFVSICEQLDFTTPMGRLSAGLLAVFAQFEREMLVENVKAGIAAYRAKHGGKWGRKPIARDQRIRILQLASEGVPKVEIARRLAIGRASVYRLLK